MAVVRFDALGWPVERGQIRHLLAHCGIVVILSCTSSKEFQENAVVNAELESKERRPLSPLTLFSAKVAIITAAALILLFCTNYYVESFVERHAEQFEQLKILQGGPVFWKQAEDKLYSLAAEPDLAPEKKKKIIDALRRLSGKYGPYFEAISGTSK
jgi:hypothetical protein